MKVLFVTYPWIGLSRGGLQIQIERTSSSLRNFGIEPVNYNPWTNQIQDVDIVHIFSTSSSVLRFVKAAREQNKPVVVSPVFNVYYRSAVLLRIQVLLSKALRGVFNELKCAMEILRSANAVISLSTDEAKRIQNVFSVDADRQYIIPNGFEDRFYGSNPGLFNEKYGMRDFVLCVGKIEQRKNQYALIKACNELKKELVLIGSENAAEREYFEKCKKIAGDDVLFLGELKHNDPLLASAYAAADTFALVSKSEVLPLSIFEAILSGCKLLVTEKSAVKATVGDSPGIIYTHPNWKNVKQKLSMVDSMKIDDSIALRILKENTWNSVAKRIVEVYKKMLVG